MEVHCPRRFPAWGFWLGVNTAHLSKHGSHLVAETWIIHHWSLVGNSHPQFRRCLARLIPKEKQPHHRRKQHGHILNQDTMAVVARSSKQQDAKNDEHVALIHKNDQGAIKHRHAVAQHQHGGGGDKDHGMPAAASVASPAKQRGLSSCSNQYNSSTAFHKRIFWILAVICTLTGVKSLISATKDFKSFNSIDDYANGVWKWFEDRGIIQKWPGFVLDYQEVRVCVIPTGLVICSRLHTILF
jgi:hypothetical protein